jgi:hypothetical protein
MQLNDLPLDCIRQIAMVSVASYRAMLMIRRFALTTLPSPDNYGANIRYRKHFTVKVVKISEQPYSSIKYKLNGMKHRDDDLPAVISFDEDYLPEKWRIQEWYQMGKLHRDNDKPAVIDIYSERWYQHGKQHRDGNKPAYIFDDDDQEWWVDGVMVYSLK